MTTPTTKNPYLLYGDEPPQWFTCGNIEPWEDYKKRVQSQNETWWRVHTTDGNYPHQTETPINVEGSDFPLGQGNRYGPFIYCPFPTEGIVRWGFRRADGFAAFKQDVANDSLPKQPRASVPSARSKPAAKAPEPVPTDVAAAEPDPFADLVMGAPAAAVEPDPFADLAMGDPKADPAPAEPTFAAQMEGDDEPEVDEWGEVIQKSTADPEDPFAGLI